MPITDDTVLNAVRLLCTSGIVRGIQYFSGGPNGTKLGELRPRESGRLYNTEGADFTQLRHRLGAGTATLYYVIGTTPYLETDIPVGAEWAIDRNPFRLYASAHETPDIGPYSQIRYKRFPVGTIAHGPLVLIFTGDLTALDTLLTSEGWLRRPDSGTDLLYHLTVNYWRLATVTGVNASPPVSDNIQYSTDDGQTWSTTPPADFDDVDVVSIHGVDGWVDIQVGVDEVIENSPLEEVGGDNVYYSFPKRLSLEGFTLSHIYALQVEFDTRTGWGSSPRGIEGWASMLSTSINMVYPHEVAYGDGRWDVPTGKKLLVMQNKATGIVTLSHYNDYAVIADNDSDHYLLRCCVEAYPMTTLSDALSSSQGWIQLTSLKGISTGDVLFVDSEQMIVTGTTTLLGGETVLTVQRNANGTSAASHGLGAVCRAIVNADAPRYFTIINVHGGVEHRATLRVFILRHRAETSGG